MLIHKQIVLEGFRVHMGGKLKSKLFAPARPTYAAVMSSGGFQALSELTVLRDGLSISPTSEHEPIDSQFRHSKSCPIAITLSVRVCVCVCVYVCVCACVCVCVCV